MKLFKVEGFKGNQSIDTKREKKEFYVLANELEEVLEEIKKYTNDQYFVILSAQIVSSVFSSDGFPVLLDSTVINPGQPKILIVAVTKDKSTGVVKKVHEVYSYTIDQCESQIEEHRKHMPEDETFEVLTIVERTRTIKSMYNNE